jgi:hypothetical protein
VLVNNCRRESKREREAIESERANERESESSERERERELESERAQERETTRERVQERGRERKRERESESDTTTPLSALHLPSPISIYKIPRQHKTVNLLISLFLQVKNCVLLLTLTCLYYYLLGLIFYSFLLYPPLVLAHFINYLPRLFYNF